ncbi:MAG: response regulator transcription factor [Lachnospiraceae bacterium]|nr:response regulator transcription factor [Lachnospiraceae bacterium]
MNKIKVIIVDDQAMPRELFKLMLDKSERYELLYALESASVVNMYCDRYAVDLIVMDVVMGDGSNGLDAAERVKSTHPEIKIIIVTSMPEVSYLERARMIGVESFWYKEKWGSETDIMEVMDRTMDGESVYPDSAPAVQLGNVASSEITEAEIAVLRGLVSGMSNIEIAEHLHLSPATVKTHISNMLMKTGFANRTELAIQVRTLGLVIND